MVDCCYDLIMEIKDKELHRIAVTAIVYRQDGRYLITRRSLDKKHFPGRWTVPGGGLDIDDYINLPKDSDDAWYYPLTKALRREVMEEVGLEIGKPEYLLDLTFLREDGVPVLTLSYFAEYLSGEAILDEDTIDLKWVSPHELKDYDLISGIDREIKMVDEILKERKKGL